MHQFVGGERVARTDFVFAGEYGVEHVGLVFGEVSPAEFGTALLGAQVVDAGRHRYARNPVSERHVALILCDAGEHFQENLLCEVFFGHAPRQARPHDANDHRVKVFDQFPRRPLVGRPYTLQTSAEVECLVVRGHRWRNEPAYTLGKTPLRAPGYTRGPTSNAFLDFARGRRVFNLIS